MLIYFKLFKTDAIWEHEKAIVNTYIGGWIYRGKGENQKEEYSGVKVVYNKISDTCRNDLCLGIYSIRNKDFAE